MNAISSQNLIVPSGTMKMDRFEYAIETNSAPSIVDALERSAHPHRERRDHLRSRRGARARRQSAADQHRPRGRQARHHDEHHEDRLGLDAANHQGRARRRSTDDARASCRRNLQINALSDQSIFVRGAISGVVREALIAACLTAVMILVFLGSWRSTLIIAVSIPLSILCSFDRALALLARRSTS